MLTPSWHHAFAPPPEEPPRWMPLTRYRSAWSELSAQVVPTSSVVGVTQFPCFATPDQPLECPDSQSVPAAALVRMRCLLTPLYFATWSSV